MVSSIYSSSAILRGAHERKPHTAGTGYAAKEWKIAKAREMRENPTSLERILYDALDRVLKGRRIPCWRQPVVYGYILDAYIPSKKLCFEADGPMHNAISDQFRDKHLKKAGIHTVRFTEKQLRGDADALYRRLNIIIFGGFKH